MDAINELQLIGAIIYLIFGVSVMTKGRTASFFEKFLFSLSLIAFFLFAIWKGVELFPLIQTSPTVDDFPINISLGKLSHIILTTLSILFAIFGLLVIGMVHGWKESKIQRGLFLIILTPFLYILWPKLIVLIEYFFGS